MLGLRVPSCQHVVACTPMPPMVAAIRIPRVQLVPYSTDTINWCTAATALQLWARLRCAKPRCYRLLIASPQPSCHPHDSALLMRGLSCLDWLENGVVELPVAQTLAVPQPQPQPQPLRVASQPQLDSLAWVRSKEAPAEITAHFRHRRHQRKLSAKGTTSSEPCAQTSQLI